MKENKRDAIISSTVELLQIQGYSSTGINEIIERSGSPRGSLYHYFKGGKDEIVTEALLHYGNEFASMLSALSHKSGNVKEFIHSVFSVFMDNLKNSDFSRACPVAATALELRTENLPLRNVLKDIYQMWNKITVENIIRGGNHISHNEAIQFADALISLLEGAIIAAKIKRSVSPLENALKAAMILSEKLIKK